MAKTTPNYEYMRAALRAWGQDLYLHKQHALPPLSPNPFFADRNLTRGETLSEQAFTMTCLGMVHAEQIIGRTAVDAVSRSRPLEAWRRAVHRNSYRRDLDTLDALLNETLIAGKRSAAVGSFPGGYKVPVVREALRDFGWMPKHVPLPVILQLLDEAEVKQKNAPKAEQPQP